MSVIMALIGDPEIALLDEPTTGIDPAARRSIWDLIASYREAGNSVLLTSHRFVFNTFPFFFFKTS